MSQLPRKGIQSSAQDSDESEDNTPTSQDEDTEDSKETKVFTVRLPIELMDWVDEEFYYGFKQNFIKQCFLSLHHVMTEGEVPPFKEYAIRSSIDALGELANPTRRTG